MRVELETLDGEVFEILAMESRNRGRGFALANLCEWEKQVINYYIIVISSLPKYHIANSINNVTSNRGPSNKGPSEKGTTSQQQTHYWTPFLRVLVHF